MRFIYIVPVLIAFLLPASSYAEEKPTLVVIDLKTIKADKDLAKILSERLRTALSKIGKYQLVSREEMNNIVKEMKFQRTEMCDDVKCYAEIGGALGAKKMVTGSIARMGRMYTLNLKLIDIGKAVDEGMAMKDCECTQQMLLRVVDEAAANLMGVSYTGLPVMEGDEEETEKPYVAVLEFEIDGGAPDALKGPLTDKLIGKLIKSKSFNVIDRASMEKLLKEQQFELRDCTASECAVEAGQLLGVDKVVLGRLSKIGENYFMSLQLINVGSSRIENTSELQCEADTKVAFDKINELAVKLAGGESALRGGRILGTEFKKDNFQQQGIGSLYIKSDPEGAQIIIDGIELKKKSPATVEDILVGTHYVELVKSYLVASRKVELKKDQFLTIEMKLKPIKGKIKFLSKPLDADIILDGKKIGTTPHIETNVPGGEHNVVLKRNDYAPIKFKITVKNSRMLNIKKQLKSAGTLDILCNVDAYIFLDNVKMGICPLKMDNISVGQHKLLVQKQGYEKYVNIASIRKNDTNTFNIELKPLYGYLSVLNTPEGALVKVDGKILGKTPLKKKKLKVGKIQVSLTASNYKSKLYSVVIRNNKEHIIIDILEPLPAKIIIKTEPPGADIYIDGKHSGKTFGGFISKSKTIAVYPGKHKIKLKLANYKRIKFNVKLKPGEKLQKTLMLEMTESYKNYQSHKLWRNISYIVAGLSVIGAGITGNMWLSQKSNYDKSKKNYKNSTAADDVKKHFKAMEDASSKGNIFLMTTAGLSAVSLSGFAFGLYKSATIPHYKKLQTWKNNPLTLAVMVDINRYLIKGSK